MARRSKRLVLESLEPRNLLATAGDFAPGMGGNITTEVIDGTLHIRGDAVGNQVLIEANRGPGVIVVRSEQSLINGSSTQWSAAITAYCGDGAAVFEGVTGLSIDLGDGDDFLWLDGPSFPATTIAAGGGSDTMVLGLVGEMGLTYAACGVEGNAIVVHEPATFDELSVDAGDGNDRLHANNALVNGNLLIDLGAGDDEVIEAPEQIGTYSRVLLPHGLHATGQLVIELGPDESEPPGGPAQPPDAHPLPTTMEVDPPIRTVLLPNIGSLWNSLTRRRLAVRIAPPSAAAPETQGSPTSQPEPTLDAAEPCYADPSDYPSTPGDSLDPTLFPPNEPPATAEVALVPVVPALSLPVKLRRLAR